MSSILLLLLRTIRTIVSGDKKRFQDENYDLDLTYITDRVIAMGFPASGKEAIWRNPAEEVASFFKKYHGDHFLIINLSERKYDYALFDDRVMDFGFPDHHSPPILFLDQICSTMDEFLRQDSRNVVSVHCLAGRGRTGTVIASYLTYCGLFDNGSEALEHFALRRSYVERGVQQPSQRRYVQYYSEILAGRRPEASLLILQKVVMFTIPSFQSGSGGCRPLLEILTAPTQSMSSRLITRTDPNKMYLPRDGCMEIEVGSILPSVGDIYIRCYHIMSWTRKDSESSGLSGRWNDPEQDINSIKRKFMFRFCFNTGFVPCGVLRLTKNELDDAIKDRRFDTDFFLELHFAIHSLPEEEDSSNIFDIITRPERSVTQFSRKNFGMNK